MSVLDWLRFYACPERGIPTMHRPWYRSSLPQISRQPFATGHVRTIKREETR